MFDKINNIIAKISMDNWMYICLGLIGLTFIVGLIVSLVSGEANRFKSVAKKALANPSAANLNSTALILPIKVRKQFKRAKITGEKPSDVITIDSCVTAPFAASIMAKFAKAVVTISIFAVVLMYAVGNVVLSKLKLDITDPNILTTLANAQTSVFTAMAVIVVAGLLFSCVAGVISAKSQSGAIKVFEKYVDALDKALKGDAPSYDSKTVDNIATEANSEPGFVANNQGDSEEEIPMYNPMSSFTSERTRITVELEEDAPIVMAAPIESDAEIRARAREDAMRAAKEEQARIQAESQAYAAAQAQASAQANAAAQAQAAAQANANAAMQAQAAAQAQAQARANAAQAVPTYAASAGGADDVIARIEKINREGAPLATMKEVALLLQQERAKPENKTPEQQRKLNEALASLLKAMSSATKR